MISRLFIKSFCASSFIGLSYILILELAQYLLQYQSTFAHSLSVLIFYLIGIFANYSLQRVIVFQAENKPWKLFYLYNFASAVMVSLLSGLLYQNSWLRSIVLGYIESVSTVISLLIISPITFVVFKVIFNSPEQKDHVKQP